MELFSQVRAGDQFSRMSVCTTRTTPQHHMLVFHPGFYISSYILPREPKERLRSDKPLNITYPRESVGDFISSQSGMPRDPTRPHGVPVNSVFTQLRYISLFATCFGFYKTIFRIILTIWRYIECVHT
jgi:hypothetical protein